MGAGSAGERKAGEQPAELLHQPTHGLGIHERQALFPGTAKHLVHTLFGRHTAAKETSDGFYPEHKWNVASGYRGAPYLVKQTGLARLRLLRL